MARTEYGHDPRRRLRARQAPVARLRRIRRRIARRRFGALARRFRAGGLATQGAGPAAVRRAGAADRQRERRSEEHTSELQSLMRISYAVFCLKTKTHYECNENTE